MVENYRLAQSQTHGQGLLDPKAADRDELHRYGAHASGQCRRVAQLHEEEPLFQSLRSL
jgi:hypothetical protein